MRVLALALTLLASPLWATQDRWPALFDVVGVADDDVLNVRADPSPNAPIIGTLSPDQRDVEVLNPNERETWGRINFGERTGWVSLTYLTRQPGQWYGSVPDTAYCGGTEPFWALNIDEGAVSFTLATEVPQQGRIDQLSQSRNNPGRHVLVGTLERDQGAQYLDFVALLSKEMCSDGMSDRAYGYGVEVITGNAEGFDLWSGCCALAR